LQKLGFTTIDRSLNNYGLTLILGGAEVSLWDVAQCYANQARNLNAFHQTKPHAEMGIHAWERNDHNQKALTYKAGTWWLITEALKEVQRPGIEENWKSYSSSRNIAWKTGTSFGFRDAWAVGYDAKYLVAVWAGNATGEGRPGLTGTSSAAPLLFDIFNFIDEEEWFQKPEADLKQVALCAKSGQAAKPNCPKKWRDIVYKSRIPAPCVYHQNIQLNQAGLRVYRDCNEDMVICDTSWFVLDPIASYYYRKGHSQYKDPPPYSKNCNSSNPSSLAIIYPTQNAQVIIPKNFEGEFESMVAEANHSDPNSTLYWHLDDLYIGETHRVHEQNLSIAPGQHQLSIIDENGNTVRLSFVGY